MLDTSFFEVIVRTEKRNKKTNNILDTDIGFL